MAHWAELDDKNKVIRVLVGDNNDPNGDEGYQWLIDNLGGTWIKTSYNSSIRFNYAGVGYLYDPDADAFIAPRPECGHTELFLNDNYKWNCQRCELDAKKL
jgi:hypothetical protein